MTKKAIANGLLSLLLVLMISGCSTIKGWFSSTKPDRPPDVLTQEGIKDLRKKNYIDAIETFQKVKDRYPYSHEATLAQLKVADAYFYDKKYDEAMQAYREFEKLHPTSKAVPYCIYREGLSCYRQRSTIDRDQTYTHKAIAEFTRLKQKYPDSQFIPGADRCLARCRQDLAEHEFYVAEFYYATEHYPAAIERYQTLIQDYPEFPKNALAKERIKKCQALEANKSKPKGILGDIASIFDAKW
jgi:outer membrane protein assembly factor BamD